MALLNLKNKKIVISAGASGIGWATAKIFLSRGANVYLCDIDKALSDDTVILRKNSYAYIMDKSFSIDIDDRSDFDIADVLARVAGGL